MKVNSESEVAQSCPTLSNPIDCSPPGSSIHGIFQARVLEWGAIAFTADSTYVTSIIHMHRFSEIAIKSIEVVRVLSIKFRSVFENPVVKTFSPTMRDQKM